MTDRAVLGNESLGKCFQASVYVNSLSHPKSMAQLHITLPKKRTIPEVKIKTNIKCLLIFFRSLGLTYTHYYI